MTKIDQRATVATNRKKDPLASLLPLFGHERIAKPATTETMHDNVRIKIPQG